MELKTRKVQRFRCRIDPQIGPMPRNAFDCKEHALEAELTPIGVYVKFLKRQNHPESEHLVPYANVDSIKLQPVSKDSEEKPEKKAA